MACHLFGPNSITWINVCLFSIEPFRYRFCWKCIQNTIIFIKKCIKKSHVCNHALLTVNEYVISSLTFLGSISSKWFCTNCTVAVKSDWLNSYGIFHPMGPYFLRSCTVVWRNATPYNMGFHCGMEEISSWSWVMRPYVLLRPAFTPCGGSAVNLMDTCSKLIGNLGWGSVVIQQRKRSCTVSVSVICKWW